MGYKVLHRRLNYTCFSLLLHQFSRTDITSHHLLSDLQQRDLFPHTSGVNPRSMYQQTFFLPSPLLSACRQLWCPYMAFSLRANVHVSTEVEIRKTVIELGSRPYDLI